MSLVVRYMVLRFASWNTLVHEDGTPARASRNMKSSGFIAVYDTLEALRAEYGENAKFTTITTEETT